MHKARAILAPAVLIVLTALIAAGALAPPASAAGAPIVVSNSEQLKAALVDANAGRTIHVRAGVYRVDGPLTVPAGATLEGEGVMLGDDLPGGFRPGTETRLVADGTFTGEMLRLRNGVSVRRLSVEDVSGRNGNVIGVVSERPHGSVAASISECRIVNPNMPGANRDGPVGGGIVALTRNRALGADPPPDVGSTINVQVMRSIVSAAGRAIFAMNFAQGGRVNLVLSDNVVAGTLDAIGGISRPDTVSGAAVAIVSEQNVYRPSAESGVGWQIGGGSSAPIPFPTAGTFGNRVSVDSSGDVIEGAVTGILAFAGRRLDTLAGPSSDNSVQLTLRDLRIRTSGPGAADLELVGAWALGEFPPGDRNTLSVVMRGATGSGPRANLYANVRGPTDPANFGMRNRLVFAGTPVQFAAANRGIDPAPPAEFFTR
jgi:hypothetical protein